MIETPENFCSGENSTDLFVSSDRWVAAVEVHGFRGDDQDSAVYDPATLYPVHGQFDPHF